VSGQKRQIVWDEENRVQAIVDNGSVQHYVYDAAGERVLKGSSAGQAIHVNKEQRGGTGGMGNYTVYVNPYLVLKSGSYTKHYYIEGQRITSKLGAGWDIKTNVKAGGDKVDFAGKKQRLEGGAGQEPQVSGRGRHDIDGRPQRQSAAGAAQRHSYGHGPSTTPTTWAAPATSPMPVGKFISIWNTSLLGRPLWKSTAIPTAHLTCSTARSWTRRRGCIIMKPGIMTRGRVFGGVWIRWRRSLPTGRPITMD
jgi:YD repeat-containing protein